MLILGKGPSHPEGRTVSAVDVTSTSVKQAIDCMFVDKLLLITGHNITGQDITGHEVLFGPPYKPLFE